MLIVFYWLLGLAVMAGTFFFILKGALLLQDARDKWEEWRNARKERERVLVFKEHLKSKNRDASSPSSETSATLANQKASALAPDVTVSKAELPEPMARQAVTLRWSSYAGQFRALS